MKVAEFGLVIFKMSRRRVACVSSFLFRGRIGIVEARGAFVQVLRQILITFGKDGVSGPGFEDAHDVGEQVVIYLVGDHPTSSNTVVSEADKVKFRPKMVLRGNHRTSILSSVTRRATAAKESRREGRSQAFAFIYVLSKLFQSGEV